MTSYDAFRAPNSRSQKKMASHAYGPGEYFRRYQAEAIVNKHRSDENNVEECNVSTDVPNVDRASAPTISSTRRRPNNNSHRTAKRKAKPTSDPVPPKRPKKFAWSPGAAEVLLKYVKEFQTRVKCEYNVTDFEDDSVVYRSTPLHGH